MMSLQQTSEQIGLELAAACAGFEESVKVTLLKAIDIGAILERARLVVPNGQWTAWIDQYFPYSLSQAQRWMRFSRHRELVENASGPYEAAQILRGLKMGMDRTPKDWAGYPDWMRNEALQLQAEGMSQRQVARTLGVSPTTVHNWQQPVNLYHERRKEKRRRAREAEQWRKQQARYEAAQKAGGALARSYSTLRMFLEALDASIVDADSQDAKHALRVARDRASQVESLLLTALGVE